MTDDTDLYDYDFIDPENDASTDPDLRTCDGAPDYVEDRETRSECITADEESSIYEQLDPSMRPKPQNDSGSSLTEVFRGVFRRLFR